MVMKWLLRNKNQTQNETKLPSFYSLLHEFTAFGEEENGVNTEERNAAWK